MPLETVYLGTHTDMKEIFPALSQFEDSTSLRQLMDKSQSASDFKKELARSVADFFEPVKTDFYKNGERTEKTTMCPHQAAINKPVDPKEFSVEVFIHDSKSGKSKEKIASFGHGTRKLKLVFASVDLAGRYLVDQAGPIVAQSVHYEYNGPDEDDTQHILNPANYSRIERMVYSRRFAKPASSAMASPSHESNSSATGSR